MPCQCQASRQYQVMSMSSHVSVKSRQYQVMSMSSHVNVKSCQCQVISMSSHVNVKSCQVMSMSMSMSSHVNAPSVTNNLNTTTCTLQLVLIDLTNQGLPDCLITALAHCESLF